ncbi:UNVERIFIED_ORG: hypothetical protein FHR35_009152 [Microbispora rosea subsp. rosea]
MPSTTDLDQLARRRLRQALTAAGVVIVVLVLALAVLLNRQRQTPPPAVQAIATVSPAPPAGAATPADSRDGYVVPARWTALPNAARYLRQMYPINFPHTAASAAAAATAMYQHVLAIDMGQVMSAVDVYVASADRAAVKREATGNSVWLRGQMGLPPSGQLPPEAGVVAQPVGVRWQVNGPDDVYVSVDMSLDMLPGGDADSITMTVAMTVHMQWRADIRGGDWVARRTPARQMPQPKAADLGSGDFNAQGWMALRGG